MSEINTIDQGIFDRDFSGDQPWKTLFALYRPRALTLAAGVFWFILKSSPAWLLPIIVATIIDALAKPRAQALVIILWCGVGGAVALVQNVLTHTLYMRQISQAARVVEASLRLALCRRLQELSISFYRFRSAGQLQSKVLRDVENVDLMARQMADLLLNAVVLVTATLIVTAFRAPWFIPFYLLTVPTVVGIRRLMQERLRFANRQFRREVETMSASLAGMIEMVPLTRAHAAEEMELNKMRGKIDSLRESGHLVDSQTAVLGSTVWVLFTGMYLAGVIVAAGARVLGLVSLTAGEIVMLSGFFNTICSTIMSLANALPSLSRGLESVRSIGEVLNYPDIEQNRNKPRLSSLRGEFSLESIVFNYPDQPDKRALDDVSFHVPAGRSVAVVGPSGCGKSTLMSLLLGFHRPSSGRILLDGQDMNDFDLRDYRRFLAVVAQETLLFPGSVRENIVYGTPRIGAAQIHQALKDANALEFVERLPNGLDTIVGEHGSLLSGGQRQRLAVARALIRNPRVLILDEATSALDVENETLVQQSIDRLREGRTTFIVAHHLSTTRSADYIVTLAQGRVVSFENKSAHSVTGR